MHRVNNTYSNEQLLLIYTYELWDRPYVSFQEILCLQILC